MILDRMNKLGKREKVMLLAALLIFGAFLVDGMIVRALSRRLRQLDDGIAAAIVRLRYNRTVLVSTDEIRREFETTRGLLGAAASSAAAGDALKGEVDEIARKTGVLLVSMDQKETRRVGACEEMVVDITRCEGDMADILAFLCEMRSATVALNVDRLGLSPMEDGRKVKASIQLSRAFVIEP